MRNKINILTIILLASTFQANAQSVIGFWEVTSVTVGDRLMTPVAKWSKINSDGTQESGNGWTKNAHGTWSFDEKSNEYLPLSKNGVKDELGAFVVHFSEIGMTWERIEEGMKVVVSLIPITEMPTAPADKLPGLWTLSSVLKADKEIKTTVDPNEKQFIHIRPDRRYELRLREAQVEYGVWHINGHRPELTLLSDNREDENKVYSISFEQSQLIMKQKNNDDLIFVYDKKNAFPE